MTDQQEHLYCASMARAQLELAYAALLEATRNLNVVVDGGDHPVLDLTSQALARVSAAINGTPNILDVVREVAS